MLDIETLGTTLGSVVLSIGAVAFDLEQPQKIDALPSFFAAIDIEDSLCVGLHVDAATLKWWLQQRPEILKAQMEKAIGLKDALMIFTEWLVAKDCTYIWGNSAAFDCGLLGAAYKAANVQQPWSHRNERCYRTVAHLTEAVTWDEKDAAQAHNPVYDAQYQVRHLWKCAAELGIIQYHKLNEA